MFYRTSSPLGPQPKKRGPMAILFLQLSRIGRIQPDTRLPKTHAIGQRQWWKRLNELLGRSSAVLTNHERQKKQSVTDQPTYTDGPKNKKSNARDLKGICYKRLFISCVIECTPVKRVGEWWMNLWECWWAWLCHWPQQLPYSLWSYPELGTPQ